MSIKIIGMGRAVPEKSVSNDELASFLDTNDEWIVSRTGISSRHVCTSETLTDLSASASKQALEKAKLTACDIDLIICSTFCGEYLTPSLACSAAEQIGAACPAFDINAACTGFIYALEVACGFFSMGKARNILIVSAEKMSTQVDWNDRNTCVLFGDGAAATVVTAGNALKYMTLSTIADTSTLNLPTTTGNSPFVSEKVEKSFLMMQGQEVFKFAVGAVGPEIRKALEKLEMSPEQVDWYVLHQANKRIIDSIRIKLQLPEEKFPINIDKYGNLSSVSIPLLLCEMLEEKKLKAGDSVFMSAFGAGLTVGSCVMVWE